MDNTKPCRCCKNDIPGNASWCQHCQRPQSLFRALFPPQAIIVIVIALSGYWYVTNQAMKSVTQSSDLAIYEGGDQLQISDTLFKISREGCETCIASMGTIKNTTDTAWTNIHFQVTYFDKAGNIVDVLNDEDSDLVVGPNTERKFKVSGKASADAAEYQSNKVEITKASPDTGWY